jgi:type VI secretion system protein ImpC
MATPWNLSFGRVQLGSGAAPAPGRPEDDTPFRILLLGDFSGRGSRAARAENLAGRKPVRIDPDNFEEVMAGMGVEVHVPLAADGPGRVVVRPRELDDFHPDRLVEQLDLFEELRGLRRRLGQPGGRAAEEVRRLLAAPPSATPAPPASDLDALREQLLGGAAPPPPADDFQSFLRGVVGPHLVAADDPRQAQLEAALDGAIGAAMRTLLHHPAFQQIEAAWRALFLLVRRLETDATLQLHLLDLSRAELVADLAAADDLRTSWLYRVLVEQTVGTPGGKPWAVLAGDYTFAPTASDAGILRRLSLLAAHAGAPFVAAAHPRVFGSPGLGVAADPDGWTAAPEAEAASVWSALRQVPEAGYLGLAAPRFLLRYPYGSDTSPTERFDFEELTDPPAHEDFLWGSPAFAVALLLGRAFCADGWSLTLGDVGELESLPAVVFDDDGDRKLKPCAEVVLTDRGLEKLLDAGVLPLLAAPDSDRVRLARVQSLASPPAALAGRWQAS